MKLIFSKCIPYLQPFIELFDYFFSSSEEEREETTLQSVPKFPTTSKGQLSTLSENAVVTDKVSLISKSSTNEATTTNNGEISTLFESSTDTDKTKKPIETTNVMPPTVM